MMKKTLFTIGLFALLSGATYAQDTVMTLEELSQHDGKNGRPAYIAVDGIVYDVSSFVAWENGEHIPSNGLAHAGIDATSIIDQSPHGKQILQRAPVVGKLAEDSNQTQSELGTINTPTVSPEVIDNSLPSELTHEDIHDVPGVVQE